MVEISLLKEWVAFLIAPLMVGKTSSVDLCRDCVEDITGRGRRPNQDEILILGEALYVGKGIFGDSLR